MAPAGGADDAEVDPPEGPKVRKMQVKRGGGGEGGLLSLFYWARL